MLLIESRAALQYGRSFTFDILLLHYAAYFSVFSTPDIKSLNFSHDLLNITSLFSSRQALDRYLAVQWHKETTSKKNALQCASALASFAKALCKKYNLTAIYFATDFPLSSLEFIPTSQTVL